MDIEDIIIRIYVCDKCVDHGGELYIIGKKTKRAVYIPCKTHQSEGYLYELCEEHFKAINEKQS